MYDVSNGRFQIIQKTRENEELLVQAQQANDAPARAEADAAMLRMKDAEQNLEQAQTEASQLGQAQKDAQLQLKVAQNAVTQFSIDHSAAEAELMK